MHNPRVGRARGLVVHALLTTACIDEPAPEPTPIEPPDIETSLVYESERVKVFTEPGMPFCRGDGARMDEHINRLSTHIDVDPPGQIQVYVVKDNHGPLIADWCFGSKETLGGCAQYGMIMAKMWAIPHEINHAVFGVLNSDAYLASRFWLEAYASAYEVDESKQYYLWELDEQTTSAAYAEGDHLVRWLEHTRGTEKVVEFYASLEHNWARPEVDAAFAETFGFSYAQALEKYAAEAAFMYPGFGWCDDVPVIEAPLGETYVTLRADCDQPDTYAFADPPIEAMYVRRALHVEQSSEAWIEAPTDFGILNIHPCLEEPAYGENDPRLNTFYFDIGGDVPPMSTLAGPIELEPGNTLVEFVFPLGDPVEADLTITAEPMP